MERTTIKHFKETYIDTNFQDVTECRYYAVQTEDEVSYGKQQDVNFEYCQQHNIPMYDLKRDGGCIVHGKDNIAWAEIKPNSAKDFYYTNLDFLSHFTDFLKEKGLNAIQEDNDILIDGYKVASGCNINLPPDYKRTFSAVQISWKCDIDLIRNICLKPMVKIPKGLDEYNITQEDIIDFIQDYFKDK